MTEDSTYYTVTYKNLNFPDEIRTTIISAPHTKSRIREILADAHPEWEIISILPNNNYRT
mgnify:FL=1